jgi:hypothetical protein
MKLIRKAKIKSNNESRLKSGVFGECVPGGGRERRRRGGGGFINALFVEMMKWDENGQLHTCKNKKMVSMKGM